MEQKNQFLITEQFKYLIISFYFVVNFTNNLKINFDNCVLNVAHITLHYIFGFGLTGLDNPFDWVYCRAGNALQLQWNFRRVKCIRGESDHFKKTFLFN